MHRPHPSPVPRKVSRPSRWERLPVRLATWAAVVLVAFSTTTTAVDADESAYQALLERAVRILQEAEQHYYGGRAEPARRQARRARLLLEQAHNMRPRATEPPLLATQASVFASDGAGARKWLERYAKRSIKGAEDPVVHDLRGMILLHLGGQPAAAVKALERALALAPREESRARHLLYYAALFADGEENVRGGSHEKALLRFQRATQVAGLIGDVRKARAARGNAGLVLVEEGRHEDAALVFARLAAEDRRNPLWTWYQGRSLRAAGARDAAAAAFHRTARLVDEGGAPEAHRPMVLEARYAEAECLLESAEAAAEAGLRQAALAGARSALERYVADVPESLRGRFVLGRLLYEAFGAPYEAVEHLERAREIDPVCDAALRLLIRIAARHGPPPAAEAGGPEAARRAWDARRQEWEAELEANGDEWERLRAERRASRADGSDGCP